MSGAVIAIVDDDDAIRDSLGTVLELRGYAISPHASAEAFLDSPDLTRVSCALVDFRMTGMDGLALLERLRANRVATPIILVTGHGDIPLAVRAMRAGASDFVEKPYSADTVIDAVKRALEKAETPATPVAGSGATELVGLLTPRELDVLRHLVVGRPNKIIAYELQISPRTVEIHRANVMRKMKADSLSHLVRLALAAGL